MKNRYIDLIKQTFDFPQEGFDVIDDCLHFNGIPVMDIIEQYGTPLKISYLPKIGAQINKAKRIFNVAMARNDYKGSYTYCYCTKSSHFSFVMEEALKNQIHLETSSGFDIQIIRNLHEQGLVNKEMFILCNGFKRDNYIQGINDLIKDDFVNVIPILDNMAELDGYEKNIKKKFKIGLRIAADEEPNFEFYTSRLGIRYKDIIPFVKDRIKNNQYTELKMLHFFINTGIKDNAYYWSELSKGIDMYCELKQICPELDSLDIGGGWPIRTSLSFDYDYDYMANEIIKQIKSTCEKNNVAEPNIFTEFGSFTVGESGAVLFKTINQKTQNDKETWNMIDSSFITTLPDTWGINQKFILLAVNHWDKDYQRVNLGGLTCDSEDFYSFESQTNRVFMPRAGDSEEPLYLGFFHTGAYQEALGGYGGIQHCLIPAPKHVLIDRDANGEYTTRLFAKEQSAKSMLKILGY
ncbi:MAG TPA: arginine decarboxylase [Bacteroidia bacterium]|nr:arginine decarboxylase [Bacteroidota bacterium]HRC33737.1 arginine decarboxylase [Bacteroidia bacterium]